MANTFAALTPTVVSAAAMTALKNKTAFLTDFSTSFEGQISRRSIIQVPLYTGGTTLSNPTSFNVGTGTSTTVAITPTHLYQPITVTYGEYNFFHKLENQVGAAVNKLVDTMQSTVFALLSVASFSVGLSGVAPASVTTANLQTAWASVAGTDKVCYLTSTAYSKFLPTALTSYDPTTRTPAFGFTNFGWADSIATAETGVYGFVAADKKAFAIAAGLPELNRPDLVDSMTIDLGNGLQALLTSFYDSNTRTECIGIESMFGVAIGDANALKLVKQ